MKKQIRTLLIVCGVLVVLVAGVLALVLLQPQEESSADSSSASSAIELLTRDAAEVASIRTSGPHGGLLATQDEEGALEIKNLAGLIVDESSLASLARYATTIRGQQEVESGGDLEQFGLGSTATTVDITYTDGATQRLLVGDEVPAATTASRYVLFDDTVYVMFDLHIKWFLYEEKDYLILELTPEYTDISSGNPLYTVKSMEMGGTSREAPFRVEYASSTEMSGYSFSSYIITSPEEYSFTLNESGNTLLASPFGIKANGVEALRPDEAALAGYGLKEPYATVSVQYTDAEGQAGSYEISCSEPKDGSVYMMLAGQDAVYVADAPEPGSWIDAPYGKYINSLLLLPNINDVDRVEVDLQNVRYTFQLVHETSVGEDGKEDVELLRIEATSNNPATPASVTWEDEDGIDNFRQYYQVLLNVAQEELIEEPPVDPVPVLRITYVYKDGNIEYLECYEGPVRQVYIGLNGQVTFLTRSSLVDNVAEDSVKLMNGEEVKAY